MNKNIKMIFVAVAVIMIFSGCAQPAVQNEELSPENTQTEGPETIDEVMLSLADTLPQSPEDASDLQLGFNLDFFKKLSESGDGNLFYSSMSINSALTMAYFGAQGETQKEIADVLGYSDMSVEEVAAYQKYLLESYEDSGDTAFTSANSLWIDDEIVAKQSYIDTMENVFDTLVKNLDLQAASAPSELNAWIDESTNGMIKKLFDESGDSLARASMVLMNAIYFKGEWSVPFDPEKTFDGQFNGANKTSDIKMMMSNETVMGHQGDDYTSVILPYGDDERFAMVAVLPDDMDSFVDGLTTESLSEILTTFTEKEDPIVRIPVFEMEEKLEMGEVLKAMGIQTAFSDNADFSLMSDTSLAIDEVLHKAKIKVDEEGTEAAAVTAIVMRATSVMMDRFEFVADRPFIFFIMDTENDLVLFTGKVMNLG